MTRTLHFILFLSLISFSLKAQFEPNSEPFQPKSIIGIKAGLNMATLGGDASGISTRVGFHIGLYADLKADDNFHLQPELIYSSQGAKSNSSNEVAMYNYLNIPLIIKVYAVEGLHFDFGPQFGVLTGAEVKLNGGQKVDVKDALNSFDLSFGLGMGYNMNEIDLNLRYNLGVTTTVNEPDNPREDSFSNQVFQISIGFAISKK